MSKTPTVQFNIGIPGSGKTTASLEQLEQDPSLARVNRDDIRQMLMNLPMLPGKLEGTLTEICNQMITTLLASGRSLIVDNTHCKFSYLNEAIQLVLPYANVKFKLFDIEPSVAIERDSMRARPVGRNVIMRMHQNLEEWKAQFDFDQVIPKNSVRHMPTWAPSGRDAILVDIDGTLAHMTTRGPFDWSAVGEDSPVYQVISAVNALRESGKYMIVISGRDGVCRPETENWLRSHGVKFDELFMRAPNDMRKDSIIKKEIFDREIKGKYNVMAVFDDREQVVKTWRGLGLYVFDCNQSGMKF